MTGICTANKIETILRIHKLLFSFSGPFLDSLEDGLRKVLNLEDDQPEQAVLKLHSPSAARDAG